MKSKYSRIKGTSDILPSEVSMWREAEKIIQKISEQFSYQEIRTPSIESLELFQRNLGEGTDVVSKEMFEWKDKNEKYIALKPEMTAPVVRAYIENGLWRKNPYSKLYYIDSCFRREKPQKGRYRQFNQFGIEAFGHSTVEQDTEIILVAWKVLEALGIQDKKLNLSSMGSIETKKKYQIILDEYFKDNIKSLSKISQKRLDNNQSLRVLDSKEHLDKDIIHSAPDIRNCFSSKEEDRFSKLIANVKMELGINSVKNYKLVRGLDYYTGMVFEITTAEETSQNALCAGGRYDSLVEKMGGNSTPAVGFAAGMERLIMASSTLKPKENSLDIYIGYKDFPDWKWIAELQERINKENSHSINFYIDPERKNKLGGRYAKEAQLAIFFDGNRPEYRANRRKKQWEDMKEMYDVGSIDSIIHFFGTQ